MKKVKLGVLVSGRGSNLQAIMDQIDQGKLDAEIAVVISDKADSYGLKRIADRNIPGIVVQRNSYENQGDFEKEIAGKLKDHQVDLVILAGFMRVLSGAFIQEFPQKMINIHPSLLPSFTGLHAQKKALEYGVKYSGCTVHFVTEEVDGGPIISQSVVPVLEDDTEESLAERILIEEHKLLPKAIQDYICGYIEIKGRKVIVKGTEKKDDYTK